MMQSRIENLKAERDELQQYQRKHNLEIHGNSEEEDENVEEAIVLNTRRKVGCQYGKLWHRYCT